MNQRDDRPDTPLSELPFSRELERELLSAATRKVGDARRPRAVPARRVAAWVAACVLVALIPAGIAIVLTDTFGTDNEPDAVASPSAAPLQDIGGFLAVEADPLPSGVQRTFRVRFTLDGDLPPNSRVVIDLFDAPMHIFPSDDRRIQQEGGSGLGYYFPVTPSLEYVSGPDGDPHAATIELRLTGINIPPDFDRDQIASFYRPDRDVGMQTTFRIGDRE